MDKNIAPDWRWKGRRVLAFDDSTVSMPDTPANQSAYPQPESQKPGVGFPRARIAAVFSLSCGAALDLGFCRYAGKGQSELGLLRTLWDKFRPGDVVLTDRRMCTWTEMVMLKQRGIDSVTRLNINRSADFKSGKRLGKGDYIVVWEKPTKPRSIDRKTFDSLPYLLKVRELLVHVEQPGFRSKTIIVVTTLLNEDITKDELAQLYRARWNVELDLRSSESLLVLYEQLLDAVASHRVADRPDRFEPRKKKRRDGKYDLLTKPRREAKADILKGLSKI